MKQKYKSIFVMHLLTSNMHKNYMAYYDYHHHHHHHYHYYYYYSVAAQGRGTSCDNHHSSFRAF